MVDNRLPDFDLVVTEVVLAHECIYQENSFSDGYASGRMCSGIVYVMSGSANYIVNNKTMMVKAGDIVYLPSESAYIVKVCNDAFHHYTINFNLAETIHQNAITRMINAKEISILNTKNEAQYRNWFEKISSIWYDKKSGYKLLCKAYLYEALHSFFAEYIGMTLNQNDLDRILPAKRYIDEYYMRNISVATMSEMCGISQTHFRRLFKELYGTSPVDYQISMRLLKAKDLLLLKMYSVREVADMVGFYDTNYFSRVFKERIGISPLKYKILY